MISELANARRANIFCYCGTLMKICIHYLRVRAKIAKKKN
jgi:hypothetical protein